MGAGSAGAASLLLAALGPVLGINRHLTCDDRKWERFGGHVASSN
jgi:hypothetical protein